MRYNPSFQSRKKNKEEVKANVERYTKLASMGLVLLVIVYLFLKMLLPVTVK
jgi:hypothetical protein